MDSGIFRSSKLGQVFDHTSASYKFYWLWSILDLLESSQDGTISFREIYARMVARSYTSVAYFRLSLGASDKLADLVEVLRTTGIPATATVEEVQAAAMAYPGLFKNFNPPVSFRLLSPWVEKSSGISKGELEDEVIRKANMSQVGEDPMPYGFGETRDRIIVGPRWRSFLLENRVAIEGFIKLQLVSYLEARNPHSSNLTQKLALQATRDLKYARAFWGRTLERNRGMLMNIYTSAPLSEPFVVDHFIPFSFVAHDHLWNLIPTDGSSNSSKSDRLPDLAKFLAVYTDAHYLGIHANQDEDLEDYCIALRVGRDELVQMKTTCLQDKLQQLLKPKLAEAMASGF